MDRASVRNNDFTYISELYYSLCIPGAIFAAVVDLMLALGAIISIARASSITPLTESVLSVLVGFTFLATVPAFLVFSFINLYPKIKIDIQGITISFNHFSRLNVPWQDVTGIKHGNLGLGVRVYFRGGKWIHRFYGNYIRHAFLIDPRMKGVGTLLSIIQQEYENREQSASQL